MLVIRSIATPAATAVVSDTLLPVGYCHQSSCRSWPLRLLMCNCGWSCHWYYHFSHFILNDISISESFFRCNIALVIYHKRLRRTAWWGRPRHGARGEMTSWPLTKTAVRGLLLLGYLLPRDQKLLLPMTQTTYLSSLRFRSLQEMLAQSQVTRLCFIRDMHNTKKDWWEQENY